MFNELEEFIQLINRSYLLIRQLTTCGPLLYKEHDLFIFTTQVINLSMSNKVVLFQLDNKLKNRWIKSNKNDHNNMEKKYIFLKRG